MVLWSKIGARGRRGVRVAAAVALVAVLAACDREDIVEADPIRPVRAVQLEDSAGLTRRWFSGRARATQELDLSFRVGGTVTELPVNVGDEIDVGAVVARLDPTTFAADRDRAEADRNRAEAELVNARAQLERGQQLAQRGTLSEASLDEFIAAAQVAEASLAAAEAVLRRAELDLSYTILETPFAGRVTRTYVDNFQDVVAKQAVVRVVDRSRIEMVVDIPESLISYADDVEEIEVVFDAFPDLVIPASIKEIGAEPSATTRTYPVTVIMDQPEEVDILPGMAGRATSREDPRGPELATGLVVPETALFTQGAEAQSFVWVVDDETLSVSAREVRTSELTRFGYTVMAGLEPGDWVVTAGVHHLREGQVVRILEQ